MGFYGEKQRVSYGGIRSLLFLGVLRYFFSAMWLFCPLGSSEFYDAVLCLASSFAIPHFPGHVPNEASAVLSLLHIAHSFCASKGSVALYRIPVIGYWVDWFWTRFHLFCRSLWSLAHNLHLRFFHFRTLCCRVWFHILGALPATTFWSAFLAMLYPTSCWSTTVTDAVAFPFVSNIPCGSSSSAKMTYWGLFMGKRAKSENIQVPQAATMQSNIFILLIFFEIPLRVFLVSVSGTWHPSMLTLLANNAKMLLILYHIQKIQ